MSGETFFEGHDVAVGVVPSDLDSGQHPTHGFWVDMDGYDGVAILFVKNSGITGNDPTFRLQQAKDGSGTDAKHLYFHRVLRKSSASTSIRGRWDIASDRETNLFTYDTWGEENTILGVYVERRWLDEDYNFLRATIFDPGDVPFQSPNYRGTWSGSTTYAVGDMVNVTTTLWYAVAASTNSHPAANNVNWEEFTGTPPGQYGTIIYIGDKGDYIGRDVPIL